MSKLSDLLTNPQVPGLIFVPELIQLHGLEEPVKLGTHALLQRVPQQSRDRLKYILDPFINMRTHWRVSPWEVEEVSESPGSTRFEPILDASKHQFWTV